MMAPKELRLRLVTVTLAFTITTVAVIVCGEIAVRYREGHRATVPGSMPFLFYRHRTLGFALVHDANYFGWVHINQQGFRGIRPVTLQQAPGVTRILAVGGSTTFDSFVTTDSAAWPARLESWLQQLYPARRFEVINAGVPGYVVSQDLIRLETELYQYKPDLMIFYQGHNDLIANLRPYMQTLNDQNHRPHAVGAITPWKMWLEQNSLLYSKLVARFKLIKFKSVATAGAATASLPDLGVAQFRLSVRQYLSVAQALELPVVIPEIVQISGSNSVEVDPILTAMWRATMPYANPDTVLRAYKRYNEVLSQEAHRAIVTMLPMVNLGLSGTRYYSPGDPIHFNDLGANRFAEGLARRLIASNLLPDPDSAENRSD